MYRPCIDSIKHQVSITLIFQYKTEGSEPMPHLEGAIHKAHMFAPYVLDYMTRKRKVAKHAVPMYIGDSGVSKIEKSGLRKLFNPHNDVIKVL